MKKLGPLEVEVTKQSDETVVVKAKIFSFTYEISFAEFKLVAMWLIDEGEKLLVKKVK